MTMIVFISAAPHLCYQRKKTGLHEKTLAQTRCFMKKKLLSEFQHFVFHVGDDADELIEHGLEGLRTGEEQWRMISDKIASKQQSDAMADQAKEMNKIMLVARRIMHGDKVPAKDEKKLMEYDPKLYMMAKNAAAMLEMRKRKEHKSLWEDEEEKEQISATEEANNTEAFADGPEVVDVETTISNATGELDASGE